MVMEQTATTLQHQIGGRQWEIIPQRYLRLTVGYILYIRPLLMREKWVDGTLGGTTINQRHLSWISPKLMGIQNEEILAISVVAMKGAEIPKTVKLIGHIQGIEVTILIDSSSTHSFVREGIADKLQGEQKSQQGIKVKIANGGTLTCI